ncbi:MAG: hypothetical protein MR426_04770 [Clostridiales bacterium]|nr:hypothetical protein [Clostridiales bacterium]
MIDIRQPSITAKTEREQLLQIRSYLYQLAQQLQWAFGSIPDAGGQQTSVKSQENASSNLGDTDGPKTFAKIKNLIIKSADIVEAYRTEITKTLTGKYVASSDFGTFREQTMAAITETDRNINQNYTHIQQIETNVEGLENGIREMNAYIRTGFLYEEEDGTARYGVEIGEEAEKDGVKAFQKFARLTSDRLSFFDQNEIEVAYISDRKLYITSAQVQEIEAKRVTIQGLAIGSYILQAGNDGHLTLS